MSKKCPNCGACPECGARPPYNPIPPYYPHHPYWRGHGTPFTYTQSSGTSGVASTLPKPTN